MAAGVAHAQGSDKASALVVAVNFAVARAIAQRLRPHAVVLLGTCDDDGTSRLLQRGCDLVLLCPYLRRSERETIARLAARHCPAAAVLSIEDRKDGHVLHTLSDGSATGARLIGVIARALELPLTYEPTDSCVQLQ